MGQVGFEMSWIPRDDVMLPVYYIDLGRKSKFGNIGIKMVFKTMRVDVIAWEERKEKYLVCPYLHDAK